MNLITAVEAREIKRRSTVRTVDDISNKVRAAAEIGLDEVTIYGSYSEEIFEALRNSDFQWAINKYAHNEHVVYTISWDYDN